MAAETTAPKKICTGCGIDVTNKPRTKDPQGRYYCGKCYGKAQAAQRAKPRQADPDDGVIPIAPADDDVMARLTSDALTAASDQCPACHRPWNRNSTMCTSCGYSRVSGTQATTRVLAAEVPKEDKKYDRGAAGAGFGAILANPLVIGALFVAPILGTFALAKADPDMIGVFLLTFIVVALSTLVWTIIDAFQHEAQYGWSVLGDVLFGVVLRIVQMQTRGTVRISIFGLICFVYPIIYGLFISENGRLKIAMLSYVLGIVGLLWIASDIAFGRIDPAE